MIIVNNLFWVGTAIVILAMLRGFGLANNYTSKRAKLICIMHFVGLLMMGYGVSDLAWSYGFQNTWWETGGQALFFILGFGAFLESQKMLPMAPTNIQNMAERVATEAGQVLINSDPEHPAIGSVKQTDDVKPTYEPIKTTSLHDIEASREVPSDSEEIDTYQYDKARKVIEYNEEAERYWNEVQVLPESYQNRFLKALSDDPLTDLEALAKRLQQENQKELRPYEDDEANELLGRCRAISESAASEFMEIYELLGKKADLNYAFAKIEAKFTPERLAEDAKRIRIERQKAERAAVVAASAAEYHRREAEKLAKGKLK